MTPNEYQQLAMRTANQTLFPEQQLVNAALGLAGESGEIADAVKKHLFQGHPLDRDHLLKEAGDCAWYLALLATALHCDLSSVLTMNIDKLRKRYPDGFDAERSINRKEGDV